MGFPVVKNPLASEREVRGLDLGRSPGEGNGSPLRHSGLGNLTDRGAWWATGHGAAKSWARLSTRARNRLFISEIYWRVWNSKILKGFRLLGRDISNNYIIATQLVFAEHILSCSPGFLPGESQERGSLVGNQPSVGLHRVRHDWSNLAAAALFRTVFFGLLILDYSVKKLISSGQSLSHVQLFASPWIAARQASLSITNQSRVGGMKRSIFNWLIGLSGYNERALYPLLPLPSNTPSHLLFLPIGNNSGRYPGFLACDSSFLIPLALFFFLLPML